MLLNGDQPLSQLKEQLEEVNFPIESNVKIQTDWQLQRYAQFIKLMQTYTPKLVVIDSLIGCSGGRAFDENKSDFAQPLYWLTRNNGVLFPRTTILIIHHANKMVDLGEHQLSEMRLMKLGSYLNRPKNKSIK